MRKVLLLILLWSSAYISHAQYAPTRTVCSGTAFTFIDNASFLGGNYTWTAPTSVSAFTGGSASTLSGSASISQTLVNLTNTAPIVVTYNVTETHSNTAFTLSVTVNPTPVVSAVANQIVLNGTNTAAINFSGSFAGITFNWTNNTPAIGTPASGSNNPIAPFAAINTTLSSITANFTVTPTVVGTGCSGSSTSFTIRVDPTTYTVCSGSNNINQTFPAFPGGTYTWLAPSYSAAGIVTGTAGGPGSSSIVQSLINTSNVPVTASYPVTEAGGASFTLNYIVNPTPTVSAVTSQLLCNGTLTTPVTFSAGGTNVANTTYSWTNNTPSIGLAASGNTNIAAFTAGNATAVPITATITVTPISNTCNGSPQTFTIQVNPTPTLNSSLNPGGVTGICNGTAFSYTGTSLTPGIVFSWSRPALTGTISSSLGSNAIGNTPGNITLPETFTNSGTSASSVIYSFSTTAAGCTNSQSVTISVNPTPGMTSTLAPSALCSPNTFSYTATSITSPASFQWSLVPVTGITATGAVSGTGNISQVLANTTNAPITVTYNYIVSTNGCANSTIFPVTFNVNPPSTLTSSLTPTAICSGTTFTYTASSSTDQLVTTTYAWSRAAIAGISSTGGSNGAVASISQPLVNANINTTSVVYTFSITAYGCTNAQNVTVGVYPVPALSSTTTPLPVCSGSTFSYSPTNILSGTNFNWVRTLVTGISNPAASGTGNPAEILINTTAVPVQVNYAYTIITSAGCTSSQNLPLTVNPLPVLSSSLQAPSICTGTQFNYTPTSNTSGTLFNWTRAVVFPITNGASLGPNNPAEILVNPTLNPATATYTYTLSANGCSNTQLVTVSVNAVPAVGPQTTATCSNQAFSVTPGGVPPATLYTWSAPVITPLGAAINGGAQVTSATAIISQTLNNQTTSAATALYTVTPAASGCTGTPFSLTVTINPVPFVASQLLPATCSGTAFSFTATVVPAATTYTWFNPAQSPLNSLTGTGPQPISQPAVSQVLSSTNKIIDTAIYTVIPATAFCIGSPFSITVLVKPLPVIIDQRDTICSGAAFFISPSSGINNTTFTWANPVTSPPASITGGSAQLLPVSSISQTLLNVTSSVAQAVYTITPSVANCAGPPFTLIETVSRPIPSFGNQPVLICSGTPFDATPANAPSGTTYTWTIPVSNPTGGVTGVSAASTPQATVSQTLTNVLTVLDTVTYTVLPFLNNCQGPSFTATVKVSPIPVAILTGNATSVCQNPLPDTLSVKLNGTAPWGFTYAVNNVAYTKSGITASPYQLVLPILPKGIPARTVTISNVKDYACLNAVDTSSFSQKINALPVAQIVSLHGTYLCDGIKDTLLVQIPDSVGYQWQVNGTAASGLISDSITTLSAGTYNAIVTNKFGCSDSAAAPVTLIVASLPALNFSLDTSCIKSISHFTNLTDTTTTGAIQWAWKFGNGDTALTTNGITTYNTAGKYHVILKATQLSCPAYKPTLLDSTLNISFPVPDSILPSVSTYKSTLTPVAGRSLPGYKYLWLPSTGIQDPDSISTNFNFSSTQQYTIQLISPAGCITSDSLLVRVYDDKTLDIFVPKSFTPNGDGVNDILYPYIAGIQQFHYFRVINRYGKLLFETKNENVGWNGSVNGVAQPMSVYFWIAEGVAADGSIVQKTGQVLLIR